MSDFKADLGCGSAPDPAGGAYTAPPPEVLLNFLLLFVLWCIVTFVSILFAMPIPDTFALDVGKSDSSICVNIVVQTSAF